MGIFKQADSNDLGILVLLFVGWYIYMNTIGKSGGKLAGVDKMNDAPGVLPDKIYHDGKLVLDNGKWLDPEYGRRYLESIYGSQPNSQIPKQWESTF